MQIVGGPAQWDSLVYGGDPSCGSFLMFQLLQDSLVGSFGVNAGRDMRFACMLVASTNAVDRDALATVKLKLQDIFRQTPRTPLSKT